MGAKGCPCADGPVARGRALGDATGAAVVRRARRDCRLFELFPIERLGDVRMVATGANRQPAAAAYIRRQGESAYRLAGLTVLRIQDGEIAELTTFSPALISAFGLPQAL
jgi:hypothetical protein